MSVTDQPRISKLAVASLVAGMLFFVPIATGLLAVVAGALAINVISKSKGMLLGKGLAYSGLVLGAIHGIFWLLIAYADMSYVVDATESAVVIRNGEVSRVEEAGIHLKIPFLESVEHFPTMSLQRLNASAGPFLLRTRESLQIEYSLLWQVCSPIKTFEQIGAFNVSDIEFYIDYSLGDALRHVTVQKSSLEELTSDYKMEPSIVKTLNEQLESKGICIRTFDFLNTGEG